MQIFRIRVVLRLTENTRLHAHHAAILYSLIAAAHGIARDVEPCVPDGLLLDAPEQARLTLGKTSSYAFGFTLLAADGRDAGQLTDLLIQGLRKVGRRHDGKRVALGGNYEVQLVQDLVAAKTHQPGRELQPIPNSLLTEEIDRLRDQPQLTLYFRSPLRAHRPKNARLDGHQFFDRDYFAIQPFLDRLAARLEGLGMLEPVPHNNIASPKIIENRLVWLDLSYGPKQTRKALGGAVGRVTVAELDPYWLPILVAGQYVRIGESTRFGFGDYRIEELGTHPFPCERSQSLLALAAEQSSLDAAADRWELPSGVARQSAQELMAGTYEPQPHFKLDIPKPNGDTRTLSIPSRLDRALQRSVLEVIGPAIDLFLEESSLAYRRGLGRHTAARRLKQAYEEGFHWGMKADFVTFFDSVNHRQLRDRMEAYLADDNLTDMLMRWVQAGSPKSNCGVPTGAPISPLLANLFLDEFDESLAIKGRKLLRYADDFVILFKQREEAEQVLLDTRAAAQSLLLELNRDKTSSLDLGAGFEFLGFRFEARDEWVMTGPDGPQRIEELGWVEQRRKPSAQVEIRLPGEAAQGAMLPGIVIAGPDLEELLIHGDNLQFRYRERSGVQSLPLNQIRELTVIGSVGLPRRVLEAIQDQSINFMLIDESARIVTMLDTLEEQADAAGLIAQVDLLRDGTASLKIAKQLVSAKLHNYAALARAYRKPSESASATVSLRQLAMDAENAGEITELLGIEGRGAAVWYGGMGPRLPAGFTWSRRIAPAADDPVNILLNLAFTILYRLVRCSIRQVQLADSVGLLHRPRAGHAALASDLQEPFRHLMDRAVLETLRRIRPEDFEADERGPYPVRIKPRAIRELLAWIHRLLATPCQAIKQSEALPYRLQIARQTRSLRRAITQSDARFEPFRHP